MFCPMCGTQNKDGARFCGKCGAPIVIPEQPGGQAAQAQSAAPAQASNTPQAASAQTTGSAQPSSPRPQATGQAARSQAAKFQAARPVAVAAQATDDRASSSGTGISRRTLLIGAGLGIVAIAGVAFGVTRCTDGGSASDASPSASTESDASSEPATTGEAELVSFGEPSLERVECLDLTLDTENKIVAWVLSVEATNNTDESLRIYTGGKSLACDVTYTDNYGDKVTESENFNLNVPWHLNDIDYWMLAPRETKILKYDVEDSRSSADDYDRTLANPTIEDGALGATSSGDTEYIAVSTEECAIAVSAVVGDNNIILTVNATNPLDFNTQSMVLYFEAEYDGIPLYSSGQCHMQYVKAGQSSDGSQITMDINPNEVDLSKFAFEPVMVKISEQS